MPQKMTAHGADIRSFAARSGKKESQILDFSSNVNPLGLPASVASAYYESLSEITRYPDPQARELCREIAAQYLLKPGYVLAGNGAIALLELAIRAVKPRRALLIEPCFTEYRRLLEMHGAKVKSLALSEAAEFDFSQARMERAMADVDMVVLGHPNNPTGTALERAELQALLRLAKKKRIVFLVDEAFCDWCPERSLATVVQKNENLIVVRSLTKFFCLAGIRSGFALGSKKIIERMRSLQETWSCNALAQRLSRVAVRDPDYGRHVLNWFQTESARVYRQLASLPGLKVYPSLANFFLVRIAEKVKLSMLLETLEARGLYLRNHEGFRGLDKTFLRLSLRQPAENDLLFKVFQRILAETSASRV